VRSVMQMRPNPLETGMDADKLSEIVSAIQLKDGKPISQRELLDDSTLSQTHAERVLILEEALHAIGFAVYLEACIKLGMFCLSGNYRKQIP
jgi:hypothetical protein